MTSRFRRVLTLGVLAVALLFVTASCGGGGGNEGGAAAPLGASLVRSDALAFVSVNSDLGSSQWKTADTLSRKFPGRDKAIAQLKRSVSRQQLDYDRDIKPALGSEVDIAVVSGATLKDTSFAALTKPSDARKYKDLVAKLNAKNDSEKPAVYREIGDGWYALSSSQKMIDAVLKSGGNSLADASTFKDALDALPSDTLASAYVNGKQLATVLQQYQQQSSSPFDLSAAGLNDLDFISASLSAESEGVRARAAVSGSGAKTFSSGNYTSKLLDGVPGDALAFLSFQGSGTADQLQKLESNPQVGPGLKQMEQVFGVSLREILDLLRNEVALYVRPGTGIPEVSLLLDSSDEQKSIATLEKLFTRLGATGLTRPCSATPEDGVDVKCVAVSNLQIRYGAFDGKVLVSTGPSAISEYRSSGSKLPDDADFKEAKAAAGMPDSTGGFFYVNLKDTIPLIESLAGLGGAAPPPEVTANLAPLRSLTAWGGGSGNTRTFDAFLEIK
jgi:hypothetical protein